MADLSNKPYSAETLPPSPVTIAPALPPPRVPRLIIQTEPIALPKKFKLSNKPRQVIERENGHVWMSPSLDVPVVSCRKCGLVRRPDGSSSLCQGSAVRV